MQDVFRKEYTPLNDGKRLQMATIKTKAEELLGLFDQYVPTKERSERSRCVAIARTNLEQSIMWAIKGITTKQLEE